ncbi:histidine kinase N-terminal domain-containing protein [Alicyclobacillus sp. ALC3]|uniref:histidine kinase N-terminal domain-containing protein n=1 Tax=Alicyclobacillus sp. ALC3 TaxID=2796143 RepID=UPI002378BD85|nr:histidine kinase N-terminal domain-containing protein [Alicyclobacillus sp. ALC3]WDL99134.1 GHKL domain-containing protein [Alicyclobacillus sp. ALC3]
MLQTAGEKVADYLETNRSLLLNNWSSKVIVGATDPYKDVVRLNGSLMLDLVIACSRDLRVDEDSLRHFAQKVAMERIKSNASIGDFIYNVTIGRSEILDHMMRVDLPMDALHPVWHTINGTFDTFLYFAVHHYTDINNRKIAEQSSFIEQSHKDKLTILGQMSSSFVHEFRNPLTSVIGFVQLLQEKYPTLEYLDVMSKELNELRFRINQFLLVSKRGDDHKERSDFEMDRVVDETLEFLYPMIVSARVTITLDVDDSIHLRGYPDEIRQVLINIIMNSLDALSACKEKQITINAHTHPGQVILSISNNGPPIPPHMMQTIFEPFVTSKELGTGIGLYLCRKIVLRHNGAIECESNDDVTTFRITLPNT